MILSVKERFDSKLQQLKQRLMLSTSTPTSFLSTLKISSFSLKNFFNPFVLRSESNHNWRRILRKDLQKIDEKDPFSDIHTGLKELRWKSMIIIIIKSIIIINIIIRDSIEIEPIVRM